MRQVGRIQDSYANPRRILPVLRVFRLGYLNKEKVFYCFDKIILKFKMSQPCLHTPIYTHLLTSEIVHSNSVIVKDVVEPAVFSIG